MLSPPQDTINVVKVASEPEANANQAEAWVAVEQQLGDFVFPAQPKVHVLHPPENIEQGEFLPSKYVYREEETHQSRSTGPASVSRAGKCPDLCSRPNTLNGLHMHPVLNAMREALADFSTTSLRIGLPEELRKTHDTNAPLAPGRAVSGSVDTM